MLGIFYMFIGHCVLSLREVHVLGRFLLSCLFSCIVSCKFFLHILDTRHLLEIHVYIHSSILLLVFLFIVLPFWERVFWLWQSLTIFFFNGSPPMPPSLPLRVACLSLLPACILKIFSYCVLACIICNVPFCPLAAVKISLLLLVTATWL